MTDTATVDVVSEFLQTVSRLDRNVVTNRITLLDKQLLSMFDDLDDKSKLQVLMSCCDGMCSKRNGVPTVVTAEAAKDFSDKAKEELTDIEEANQMELIGLKSWVVKATFVMITLVSSAAVFGMVASGKDPTSFLTKTAELAWKVLVIVFS